MSKYIQVKGASLHNLQHIDIDIPRNELVVFTGVSGSGKSSLVFDTLYAEGQRKYVESLSSYARQFLGRMEKPEVDSISGLTPCVAIEQKVNTRNPRSTVATSTELYDFLKLLFARIGKTYSPVSGKEVKCHTPTDVVNIFQTLPQEALFVLTVALKINPSKWEAELDKLKKMGFTRFYSGEGKFIKIDKAEPPTKKAGTTYYLVIDRIIKDDSQVDLDIRVADSAQTAFFEGNGELVSFSVINGKEQLLSFSNKFELDGITFEKPSVNLLSFNNPYGACPTCDGFGTVIGIDEDLVVPNKSLSVSEGVVAPWRGASFQKWLTSFIENCPANFPTDKPYKQLSEDQKDLLWQGKGKAKGINAYFKFLEQKSYKIQYRILLSKYRGKTKCTDCRGTRLRKEANYIRINTQSKTPKGISKGPYPCLSDLLLLSVSDAFAYFRQAKFHPADAEIAKILLVEILHRLQYLQDVGLGYLGLNRLSNTLSGGESQRINLATSLGSSLVGSTYVLDEPSIGLHSKDTEKLVSILQKLRDRGNTVLVVEHDEDIMMAANTLIDIGPYAGRAGGKVTFHGHFDQLKDGQSLTSQYLTGKESIHVPDKRRRWNRKIEIKGASLHNLQGIDTQIPLNVLTCVTGVSGSGKTSLIKGILYPALVKAIGQYAVIKTGPFQELVGDWQDLSNVEMVDQNPIGKSSRSNPVTYIKAYDGIRDLFAKQPLSKQRGYKGKHFSFNIDGGRCDNCQGEGETIVEMQFMADLHLTCEVCKGQRFKEEVLEIKYNSKSIFDILQMTVNEAIDFFVEHAPIVNKLIPLQEVGLGYISLGQSSNTLSGGEAQRIKLASFLAKGKNQEHTLFIFDEPTTGLHFHDIKKLLKSFNALIQNGHSILVVEHHPDLIKSADWVIDLGPEGGVNGGNLVFEGTPEDLVKCKASVTGNSLIPKLRGIV